MKNLFLIGNGFDLAHGIKTSYEHFHQYLQTEYPDTYFKSTISPEASMMPDGEIVFKDNEVVGFLMHIISEAESTGEKWCDLETSLGLLDFDEFLDNWVSDGEDDNPWHEAYRNQDLASNLAGAVLKITEYFPEWIDTIEIGKISPKRDFKKLIDKDNDFFLTFNYTKTLEMLYHVKNVCHIHGEQGGELLFGHGNDEEYYEDYMARYVGSEDSLQDIQVRLRKNTTKAIHDNRDFFDNFLTSIDRIYSYGFSFSKVDEVYIQEICKRVSTKNLTWYLNDYDDVNQRKHFKEVIKSCGFQGKFSTYHIS